LEDNPAARVTSSSSRSQTCETSGVADREEEGGIPRGDAYPSCVHQHRFKDVAARRQVLLEQVVRVLIAGVQSQHSRVRFSGRGEPHRLNDEAREEGITLLKWVTEYQQA
jgi:hypothetical protein